jgi:hypothetical protein
MDFKHPAQLRHGITLLELSNYRELFSESDIKRAVVDSSDHSNTQINHV